MLKDEDRIFKNLYNDLGWDIDLAIARGDWSQTKDYISKGGSLDAIKAKYQVTDKHEKLLTTL